MRTRYIGDESITSSNKIDKLNYRNRYLGRLPRDGQTREPNDTTYGGP